MSLNQSVSLVIPTICTAAEHISYTSVLSTLTSFVGGPLPYDIFETHNIHFRNVGDRQERLCTDRDLNKKTLKADNGSEQFIGRPV
jgi:hypothetical protein